MALRHMVFSARIRDSSGAKVAAHAYYAIDDAITVNTLLGHLLGFGVDIDQVSDGVIEALFVRIEEDLEGKGVPGIAPVEQSGNFSFNATGSNRRYTFTIPAISNDVLTGDRIDLTNAGIQTLVTDWSNGDFTNEVGQGLTTLTDTFVSFRRDRKQRQRSSFERS